MNARLAHRGPDGSGTYASGAIGMAMRRLAIIDVAGGDQPIYNEDRTVVVVFNGEVYNFAALTEELVRRGHVFRTHGDTEAIVHAYEEWGDAALDRLNGMFAIALWDEGRQRLLLARDRMGQKPLYWHYGPHGLVWASELKSLLAAPWVERRIDPVALHHYLTLQYTPDPRTIFEGVNQLPAAHLLVATPGAPPRVERWWRLQFEPKLALTDKEAVAEARERLTAAVRRRLVSEVPLGAFLSGGIDSSAMVALMSALQGSPVRTFSIAFEEPRFSEARYARAVAARFGAEHHEFVFGSVDLADTVERVADAVDEPLADPAALPLYELARQARQHVTVALCGDGGDETLAGYPRYAVDRLLRPYAALPAWVSQAVVPALLAWLPEPTGSPEDSSLLVGLKRLGQFAATTPKASLVRWGSYFGEAGKRALYTDRWRDELAALDTASLVAAAYDDVEAALPLDRTLGAEQATYLAGDLLPKTDRTTMAHGLEARAPFLDREWVEWTARLPSTYKVRGLRTKWLLGATFRDMLPDGIAERRKQGFSVPIGAWLRADLRSWARERLLGEGSLGEWFRPEAVRHLCDEHDAGRVNHGKRIWALLMFALWRERVGLT